MRCPSITNSNTTDIHTLCSSTFIGMATACSSSYITSDVKTATTASLWAKHCSLSHSPLARSKSAKGRRKPAFHRHTSCSRGIGRIAVPSAAAAAAAALTPVMSERTRYSFGKQEQPVANTVVYAIRALPEATGTNFAHAMTCVSMAHAN